MKGGEIVSVVMGSQTDFQFMKASLEPLNRFRVQYEIKIVSAHRTPDRLYEYSKNLENRGLKVVIAGAGGSAHLPGMIASMTAIPVLGVPIPTSTVYMDSLLSIVQMPKGIPVGTLAIGYSGAYNAAILAVRILSLSDESLSKNLNEWMAENTQKVPHEPTK